MVVAAVRAAVLLSNFCPVPNIKTAAAVPTMD
jgi:hypothetical protein